MATTCCYFQSLGTAAPDQSVLARESSAFPSSATTAISPVRNTQISYAYTHRGSLFTSSPAPYVMLLFAAVIILHVHVTTNRDHFTMINTCCSLGIALCVCEEWTFPSDIYCSACERFVSVFYFFFVFPRVDKRLEILTQNPL